MRRARFSWVGQTDPYANSADGGRRLVTKSRLAGPGAKRVIAVRKQSVEELIQQTREAIDEVIGDTRTR